MGKRFRTTMMHEAGTDSPLIVQARIVNINLVNWTVDVVATFDRKQWFDVQVASPYLHFNRGEGFSVFPEVGAVCEVCIPGDSSPPFVLCFVMPHQIVNGGTEDAPLGTRSRGSPAQTAGDASFAGGRPKAKPGDMALRTRDGNFLILHRGGILSIGANELSQRLYIPLGNLITDVAENYAMHTAGGSTSWGLQDGPSLETLPTQQLSCFRVFADDKYADIKLAKGRVYNPLGEPDGGARMAQAGVGKGGDPDNPIVFELSVSPKGFVAESGDAADSSTVKKSVLKFVFDRTGNSLFRSEGNFFFQTSKKLDIDVGQAINVTGGKTLTVKVQDGAEVDGGSYVHLKGKTVRLGPGNRPVARLGDIVTSTLLVPVPVVFVPTIPATTPLIPGTPVPGVLTVTMPITGTISTAEPTVLT